MDWWPLLELVIFFVFQAPIFYIFLQFWRAAWRSDKAKQPWIAIMESNFGQLLFQLLKWFSQFACIIVALGMIGVSLSAIAAIIGGLR